MNKTLLTIHELTLCERLVWVEMLDSLANDTQGWARVILDLTRHGEFVGLRFPQMSMGLGWKDYGVKWKAYDVKYDESHVLPIFHCGKVRSLEELKRTKAISTGEIECIMGVILPDGNLPLIYNGKRSNLIDLVVSGEVSIHDAELIRDLIKKTKENDCIMDKEEYK